MKIHFKSQCRARVTEYWCIDPPDAWGQMSERQRIQWLEENLSAAEFRSDEIHDEEDRVVVSYHRS